MTTYADWAASRHATSTGAQPNNNSSAPVKLVIDAHGNVLQDASSTSMPTDFESSMMEETAMSVDDQQEVVQGIRRRTRSNDGNQYDQQGQHHHAATLNEEQRFWSSKVLPPSTILLVIDTNWLLSHLKLFVQIDQLVARNNDTFAPVVFILPSIVLKELDGLKHSDSPDPSAASRHTPTIGRLSRIASTFILDKLTHRPDLFRGQKADEGSIQSAVYAVKTNDEMVLDCCTYFQKQGYQVGLLSDDKILCSQAAVAGLPYMNFTPEDSNPEAFLAKLHPDLPPYLQRLKIGSTTNGLGSSVPSTSESGNGISLQAFANKTSQIQEDLLHQQMSAIAHLEHNFPLMPPELLEVISVVANSLLSPGIFPILLHHMANDNLEIFAYMLKRSSIFRDFPLSSGNDEDVLDCTRWNAAICLRLIDQNWQMCFIDKVGKVLPPTSGTANSTSNFSTSEQSTAISTGARSSSGSSLSSSRWASSSSSSFSPRRNFSPSTHSGPSTASSTFHPSKLSALAKAFASAEEDILKWSSARWRLVLEDLELFLCRTSILSNIPDGKAKAELLLNAARKNVDAWKAS